MIRLLTDAEIDGVLELSAVLDVVGDAFVRQGEGRVERPERPHFPVGEGLDGAAEPLGTGLAMPAYLHGAPHYATKLADVHPGNAAEGRPTVHAQIALTDAATGEPAAYMAGTRITNVRTGCIGGLAARELATGPVSLAVIGAGTQARWQTRAIAAATDPREVRIYSPSDSKRACAAELDAELDCPVAAAESAPEAVRGATVVVTATTSEEPVFPGGALEPGTLVIAVGAYTAAMRELDAETIEGAARVFADVPEEVAEIGDVAESRLDGSALIPFSDVVAGTAGRENGEERIVVESVGSAVLDAAVGVHVLERAEAENVGRTIDL